MKFINIIKSIVPTAAALCIVFSLSSCSEDLKNPIYTPDNADVTFEDPSVRFTLDGSDINVVLNRGVAKEALTLNLTMTDENKVFTLGTPTVTFPAGVYTATATVTYALDGLKPAVPYDFTLSFDEKDVAPTGDCVFNVYSSLPLEYQKYAVLSCTSVWLDELLADKDYELELAKYTTNYYRLVGLYGSKTDMEFYIKDGMTYITAPSPTACKYFSDPLVEILTGAVHTKYGAFTAWVDNYPEDMVWTGLADGNKVVEGSVLSMWIFPTVEAGYIIQQFTNDILTVSKVY